ncbi:MAG: sigma-70 family RNA polymerase sigma factor [Acidobacteriota bacterium]
MALFRNEKKSSDFEETFLPHLDAAYNLARWLTRDPADADDVVQEAYMRAFKFYGNYRGGDGRSWVLKIVRNTCYTWIQKNRPREIVSEFDEGLHDVETENPETILIRDIDKQKVREQMEQLPAEFREMIILRDLEGLSYKEIAGISDLPLGTVMSRLARARGKLQIALRALESSGRAK